MNLRWLLRPLRKPRQVRTQAPDVVVTAAPAFAPNSYARARLLRQLHATGMLRHQPQEPSPREITS